MLFDRIGAHVLTLASLDREQLTLVIPLVDGGAGVQPLVALQADETRIEHRRQRLRKLGLADSGLAFHQ